MRSTINPGIDYTRRPIYDISGSGDVYGDMLRAKHQQASGAAMESNNNNGLCDPPWDQSPGEPRFHDDLSRYESRRRF